MNPLLTIVPTIPSSLRVTHQRPILLIGSCFTEHIAQRLTDSGFDVLANPFGILYNPISIAECLRRCRTEEPVVEGDLVYHNNLWHSWLHHSRFSHADKDQCLRLCNESLIQAHQFILRNPIVILTLGTAYAYTLEGYGVVANCHKVPASRFNKRLMTVDEVSQSLHTALSGLDSILTISPIRHWADTPHGNQLSKSTLHLASSALPSDYFPAYEIMMDELRDYRFYDTDMLHPSSVAVEIIWERFSQTYFDDSTLSLAQKYQQLHKMQAHRPTFPDSESYRLHLAKIATLQSELDHLIKKE